MRPLAENRCSKQCYSRPGAPHSAPTKKGVPTPTLSGKRGRVPPPPKDLHSHEKMSDRQAQGRGVYRVMHTCVVAMTSVCGLWNSKYKTKKTKLRPSPRWSELLTGHSFPHQPGGHVWWRSTLHSPGHSKCLVCLLKTGCRRVATVPGQDP